MSSAPDQPGPDHLPLVLRELGEAVDLFTQVVADRLGLNRTDLAVLSLLGARGPLSAGQLAEATGLTTGAVTGVADRLERAGYARREPDPDDRRRVIVRLVPERLDRLERLHEPVHRALHVLDRGLSPAERGRVAEYIGSAAQAFRAQARTLVGEPAPARPPAADERQATAPLEGLSRARLVFTSGAVRLALGADAPAGALFLARFDGKVPKVTVRDGQVSMAYGRFSPFGWRKLSATVALSPALPWELELRGGLNRLAADLTRLSLTGLDIRGGAQAVAVSLPPPSGTVPVRFVGGAVEVSLRRPPRSEARLRVTGGATSLTFDAQQLGSVGGTVRFETAGFAAARDRYDFEFTGGAAGLAIVTG
jgi:DNA-binding MarR family transcriptional regulator